jgi:F420-dependent oxidoreductase-like protein
MLISAKLAPTFPYADLERFWVDADECGYHGVWNYDHFYGLGNDLNSQAVETHEGWTTLAAMAVLVKRARIGVMVSGVTYRHPAVLANMAVTVDHISGGRLEFGIGAAWHEPEHAGYGIPFPPAGERVSMLDEAIEVCKALWTQETTTFGGRHFTLTDALCNPKPVQRPHPPVVIGGTKPKMLKLIARHADEWNGIGSDPTLWGTLNKQIDENCAEIGREPGSIRRGVQLFLHPASEEQVEQQVALIPSYEDAGAQHVVLSFYQPPSRALLERLAPK